ncbi:glycosyltransferase [Oceanimonas sp. CHS3-5]|uniref:glycosyltransferase n=1 Tax=Oceanimonas sp. CHS3-5 TaxID=3068186 RepID=UPI00273F42F6|nr:glycosyltransferase [Oceanimonas sp. CHS3-5]MDP5292271.1 glycosyltransferase [Oceanimonas sp. CHS3-5]
MKPKKLRALLEKNNFFDSVFYLRKYQDARLSDANSIEHYIQIGFKENRKPNPSFDPEWYLSNYKDVKDAGINPVIHFIMHGLGEGRLRNEEEKLEYDRVLSLGHFDANYYKNLYEDLQSLDEKFDILTHYIRHGKYEGRKINPHLPVIQATEDSQLSSIELEEPTIYVSKDDEINPISSLSDSLAHSNELVIERNKFDPEYYLKENDDVRKAGITPEEHYWSNGEREGRKPNQWFDPSFYYKLNADVREAGIPAFRHYIESGHQEGRASHSPLQNSERVISYAHKPLLFVGHDGVLAGSEIVLLEVVRWFFNHTTRRIKLLLLAPGPVADRYAEFADVYVLSGSGVDQPEDLKTFLNEDFEFAYLNTVVSGRLFNYLEHTGAKLDCEIITHIHEMEKVLSTFPDEMEALLSRTKHWISASPASSATLEAKYQIATEALTTVPAFINPVARKEAITNELQADARKELGLSPDSFVVMGCGTVYERKGPDLFLEAARFLKTQTNRHIEFAWLGQGPDQEALEASLTEQEKSWIIFAGNRNNANKLLAAADVFFMSSREDPFPLVVLESAQHGVPTVCFEPATGIIAFIEQDAGIAVPEIDPQLAAKAIQQLLEHPQYRQELGDCARAKLFSNYTTEQQNLKIYHTIQQVTEYKPSVSVIVPFYNHEKFIEERLNSILDQPIKDIEIIALDDCSTDSTVDKVRPYLQDCRVTLIENKVNSGSPFKQWEKGIHLAQGDVVWIAEGDDSCSTNFLSELLPKFDDPLVNIAFAKVEMIDEHSNVHTGAFTPYFEMAYPGKFDTAYVKTGIQEVSEHFAAYQTLVNASGLLIRRTSFGETLETARAHKMCGDWLIYLECMKRGKIAFCPSAVNYFRRHSASQVVKIEGTEQYFRERYEITSYIIDHFPIGKKQLMGAFRAIDHEWERFSYKHPGKILNELYNKAKLIKKLSKKKTIELPSLLVVVSDLSPGGGQLFSIRLANAYRRIGGEAILVNVGKHPEHCEVSRKINQDVPLFNAAEIKLSELAEIFDIDIIHSSVWWSDKYVHENYKDLPEKVRWIVSTHGCYEALLQSEALDHDFRKYYEGMLYEVDHWVYTAEKNRKVFQKLGIPEKLSKILNGYEPELPNALDKASLGIRDGAAVLCLASRATTDKGWFVAVEAVKALNESGHKADLLLIGEGPAADKIRDSQPPEYIHLIGQVSNLQDYIAISDIGLLPSMFVSESMPLVLIEFMAQGKAMLATDIGEIRNMTQDDKGHAAVIIELQDGKVTATQFAQELKSLITNPNIIKKLETNSKRRFRYFEMSNMLTEYQKVYREVMR